MKTYILRISFLGGELLFDWECLSSTSYDVAVTAGTALAHKLGGMFLYCEEKGA